MRHLRALFWGLLLHVDTSRFNGHRPTTADFAGVVRLYDYFLLLIFTSCCGFICQNDQLS